MVYGSALCLVTELNCYLLTYYTYLLIGYISETLYTFVYLADEKTYFKINSKNEFTENGGEMDEHGVGWYSAHQCDFFAATKVLSDERETGASIYSE